MDRQRALTTLFVATTGNYTIQPINRPSGILYETLADAYIHESNWRVVSYLDLGPLERTVSSIKTIINQTARICPAKNYEQFLCKTFIDQIGIKVHVAEARFNSLLNLVYRHQYSSQRQKRDFLNFLGTIVNSNTSNMDPNDAAHYNAWINKVNADDKEILKMMKDQAVVVQSTVANFNSSITTLSQKEKLLNENLRWLNYSVAAVDSQLFKKRTRERISENLVFLSSAVETLNNDLSVIIDCILFAKLNILNPKVMSIVQLVYELKKTIPHLPQAVVYPVGISLSTMSTLLSVTNLRVGYNSNRLIFELTVPLVSAVQYLLQHIIPIPVQAYPNEPFKFIDPTVRYLALSGNKRQYFTFPDPSSCLVFDDTKYICTPSSPAMLTLSNPSCEIQSLFQNTEIPPSCNVHILPQLKAHIWHKLTHQNKWVYVLPKPESVTISCQGEALADLMLNGTGFLSLEAPCKAYTTTTTIIPTDGNSSNLTLYFPSYMLPAVNCCEEFQSDAHKEDPLLHKLNLIPDSLKIVNMDKLSLVSYKVETYKKHANDLLNRKASKKYTMVIQYIVYATVSITFVYLMVRLCMKCR